jgi:hypothetical protein
LLLGPARKLADDVDRCLLSGRWIGGRPRGSSRVSRGEAAGLVVYVALLIAFVIDVLSG